MRRRAVVGLPVQGTRVLWWIGVEPHARGEGCRYLGRSRWSGRPEEFTRLFDVVTCGFLASMNGSTFTGSQSRRRPSHGQSSRSLLVRPSRSPASISTCFTQSRTAVGHIAVLRDLTGRAIPRRHSSTISALNSSVNERRGRGFFFPTRRASFRGRKPLISDVRQSGFKPTPSRAWLPSTAKSVPCIERVARSRASSSFATARAQWQGGSIRREPEPLQPSHLLRMAVGKAPM